MTHFRKNLSVRLWVTLFIILIGFTYHTTSQTRVDQPLAQATLDRIPQQIEWNPQQPVLGAATRSGVAIFSDTFQELTVANDLQSIRSISWSPDGTRLASTRDTDIEIWDWDAGGPSLTLAATLPTSEEQLLVKWSPTGNRLASMGYTPEGLGTVYFWDVATWTLQATSSEQYLVPNDQVIQNVLDWHPLGLPLLLGIRNIATTNADGFTQFLSDPIAWVLDADTGMRINTIPLLGFGHRSAAWRPDGNRIVVGSDVGLASYGVDAGEFIDSSALVFDIDLLSWHNYSGLIVAGGVGGSIHSSLQDEDWLGNFIQEERFVAQTWKPNSYDLTFSTSSGQIAQFDLTQFPGYIPNQPPNANAGNDQSVAISGGSTVAVTLDATGSTDSDGTVTTYSWNVPGIGFFDGQTASVDLPVGVYEITLTAIDDDFALDTDIVVVTVEGN